ncbi:MAG: transposase [Verrucomicrobiales bacterium]|nr:transposase [Verrucomicrobiales bacterium]
MPKKYCIHLTESERCELKALVTAGKAAAPKRLRAQILLAADEDHPGGAMKDAEIVRALGVSICTVERTRCALAEHGLQIAVHGWPPQRKISRRKVDGWTEAHLIAASCSAPPEGRSRWTLKLLGDHVVALGLVDCLSPQTVSRTLKKTS